MRKDGPLIFSSRAYALVYSDLCLGCLRASVTHGLTLQRKIRDCSQSAELKVRVSLELESLFINKIQKKCYKSAMYKEAKILLDSLTFRFRRQHEQLRAVIVRVLQPPAVSQATPSSPGGPPKNVEDEEAKPEALLDPADANAIQEVNLAYENVKEVDGLDVSKEGSEAWEAAIKRLVNFVFMMN